MPPDADRLGLLLKAMDFSADRHRNQRRKGADASPYINYPLDVADILANVGGVEDLITLIAAVLHDTVEDTSTSFDEIEALFGRDDRARTVYIDIPGVRSTGFPTRSILPVGRGDRR